MNERTQRLDSIDLLRGVVVLLMALDHTRDFFGDLSVEPMDPAKTWPTLFITRWISHFCAPVFVFLAGTSASLQARRKSAAELSEFLITRGLWLVFLELTWVRCFGWFFNFNYHFSVGQVIWAIGWSMVALGVAVRLGLPARMAGVAGVLVIFLHNLTDGWKAERFGSFGWLWRILHDRANMEIAPGYTFFPQYPLLPWMAILFAGYGFGIVYAMEDERRRRMIAWIGAVSAALFVLIRAMNVYGDPRPWQGGIYSFLNCSKYPPSLLFILMTLGPPLVLLSRLPDKILGGWRHVVMFGRVPLFFYLIHLPLIHGAAMVYALAVYGNADWLTDAPGWGREPQPGDFGLGLPGVYVVWMAILALMYPLCVWFTRQKRENPAAWLRYF
ncbi:MAG: DUF1624 domain-containing protein [Bryobacteraceae bacterium]